MVDQKITVTLDAILGKDESNRYIQNLDKIEKKTKKISMANHINMPYTMDLVPKLPKSPLKPSMNIPKTLKDSWLTAQGISNTSLDPWGQRVNKFYEKNKKPKEKEKSMPYEASYGLPKFLASSYKNIGKRIKSVGESFKTTNSHIKTFGKNISNSVGGAITNFKKLTLSNRVGYMSMLSIMFGAMSVAATLNSLTKSVLDATGVTSIFSAVLMSVFAPILPQLIEWIMKISNYFINLPKETKLMIAKFILFGGVLATVVGAITQFALMLTGIIALGPAGVAIIAGLALAIGSFVSKLIQGDEKASSFVSNFLSNLPTIIQSVFDAGLGYITSFFSTISSGFTSMVSLFGSVDWSSIWSSFLNFSAEAGTLLLNFLGGVWDSIIAWSQSVDWLSVWKSFVTWRGDLITNITSFANTLVDNIFTEIKKINLVAVWNDMLTVSAETVTAVLAFMDNLWENIKSWVTTVNWYEVWEAFTKYTENVATMVTDFFGKVFDDIITWATTKADWKQIFQSLFTWTENIATIIGTFLGEVAGKFTSFAWSETGVTIGAEILTGILSTLGTLWDSFWGGFLGEKPSETIANLKAGGMTDQEIADWAQGHRQYGGAIHESGMYMLHAGEYVSSGQNTGLSMGGGVTNNIVINASLSNGMDVDQLARRLEQYWGSGYGR